MERLEAQVWELRNTVARLEQTLANFLIGEASRLVDLSNLMHTASRSEACSYAAGDSSQTHSASQAYEGDTWKSTVACQRAPQSFCQGHSASQANIDHLDFQNFRLEVGNWKSTVAARIQALETRLPEINRDLQHLKSCAVETLGRSSSGSPTKSSESPIKSGGLGRSSSSLKGVVSEYTHLPEINHDKPHLKSCVVETIGRSGFGSPTKRSESPNQSGGLGRSSSSLRNDDLSEFTMETQQQTHTIHTAQEELEAGFYKLEESVYDVAVILFTKLVYFEDSLLASLGIGISITIQVTLLMLLTEAGLFDMQELRLGAEVWRREHAHMIQNMVSYQNVSLTRAVCNLDTSPPPHGVSSVEFLSEVRLYTEPFLKTAVPRGLSMLMMVLVCWICDILGEVACAVKMTIAICSLPYGPQGKISIQRLTDDNKGLSMRIGYVPGPRMALLITLCAIRLCIGCYLCGVGCRWLVQTISLNELFLNAMSLEFVTNVDNLMYSFLASEELKWIVTHMAPLGFRAAASTPISFQSLKSYFSARFVHNIAPFSMVSLGVFLWCFFFFWYAVPFFNVLNDTDEALCGGEIDFVTWKDDNSTSYSWRPTSDVPQHYGNNPMPMVR